MYIGTTVIYNVIQPPYQSNAHIVANFVQLYNTKNPFGNLNKSKFYIELQNISASTIKKYTCT